MGFWLVVPDHRAHPRDVLEVCDGFGLVAGVRHLNEGEGTLAADFAVKRQATLAQRAEIGIRFLNVLHFGFEGEVTHLNGNE